MPEQFGQVGSTTGMRMITVKKIVFLLDISASLLDRVRAARICRFRYENALELSERSPNQTLSVLRGESRLWSGSYCRGMMP